MAELLEVDEAEVIPETLFVDDLVIDNLDCVELTTSHVMTTRWQGRTGALSPAITAMR